MVNDKDISSVLAMMPKDAAYYFTQASVARALPCRELKKQASTYGLEGCCYNNVSEALKTAYREADKEDFIFIGGSCFIVADLLSSLDRN